LKNRECLVEATARFERLAERETDVGAFAGRQRRLASKSRKRFSIFGARRLEVRERNRRRNR
jgi:hypothetical protein